MATPVGFDRTECPSGGNRENRKSPWETAAKIAGIGAEVLGTLESSTTYLTLEGIDFKTLRFSEFYSIISRYGSNLATLGLKDCADITLGVMTILVVQFRKMTSLTLDHCKGVENSVLEKINSLNYLQKLTLSHCDITDEGLLLLTNLTSLESLDLRGSRITDQSLLIMRDCTHLQVIDIRDCNELTWEGVQELIDKCFWVEEIKFSKQYLFSKKMIEEAKTPVLALTFVHENDLLIKPDIAPAAESKTTPPVMTLGVRSEPPKGEQCNKCCRVTKVVLRFLFGK